jgi:argininosuccinate lyase
VTLWAGRVERRARPEVWELVKAPTTRSCSRTTARRRAARAAARRAGILDADELAEVEARLSALDASMIERDDEDVHSAIERLLGAGRAGRSTRAGRATTRSCRRSGSGRSRRVRRGDGRDRGARGAVLDRAEAHAETLMPGYTHLQRAQPVTLGHHLLAWVEMLDRDRDRFTLAASHAEPSPLGAGALAGTTLPLPKVRNSLDAVADRDFALDYLYACAVLFVHLSRIGEELALWASAEFGFVRLPESAATGSSMMPQKLNPDVAELARGKAGTAIGRLTGLLATVKGLPLAYNSDLGEDKPASFAARRDVRVVLAALAVLVRDLVFCEERLRGRGSPTRLAGDRRGRSARGGGRALPRRPRRRSPGRFATGCSTHRRPRRRASPRGWVTCGRTVAACAGPLSGAVGERFREAEPPRPEGAADDRAFAAELAEGGEVVEARDSRRRRGRGRPTSSTSQGSSMSGPASEPSRRPARHEQASNPASAQRFGELARREVGLGDPAVGDDAAGLWHRRRTISRSPRWTGPRTSSSAMAAVPTINASCPLRPAPLNRLEITQSPTDLQPAHPLRPPAPRARPEGRPEKCPVEIVDVQPRRALCRKPCRGLAGSPPSIVTRSRPSFREPHAAALEDIDRRNDGKGTHSRVLAC